MRTSLLLVLLAALLASPCGASAGAGAGDKKGPLSGAEKEAVGNALGKALGVMSGKVKSGDKFSICYEMYPNGPPADAATDATWQSCKSVLPRAALLAKGRRQGKIVA